MKLSKLIKKHEDILATLKQNKATKLATDHYPYDLDIKFNEDVLEDLQNLDKHEH